MRPKDPRDLTFVLIQEAIPEGFLHGDITMKDRCHFILATNHQLENLAKAKSWYINGTFKVVRKSFQYPLNSFSCFQLLLTKFYFDNNVKRNYIYIYIFM